MLSTETFDNLDTCRSLAGRNALLLSRTSWLVSRGLSFLFTTPSLQFTSPVKTVYLHRRFQSAPPANYQTSQTPYQVVPGFARPQKGATRKTGMRFLLLILVLLVVLGVVGSTIYYLRGRNSSTTGQGVSNG